MNTRGMIKRFRKIGAGLFLLLGNAVVFAAVEIPINGERLEVEVKPGIELLVVVETMEMDIEVTGEDRSSVEIEVGDLDFDGWPHKKPHVFLDEDEGLFIVNLGVGVDGDKIKLRVPRHVSLRAKGQDCSVSVDTLAGEIEISTVDGDIELKGVSGGVVANTVDGDMKLDLFERDLRVPISLATVDGDIKVETLGELNAELVVSTIDGEFKSKLPFTMKGDGKSWAGVNLRGTLGKGGALLSLKTIDGDVKLK